MTAAAALQRSGRLYDDENSTDIRRTTVLRRGERRLDGESASG